MKNLESQIVQPLLTIAIPTWNRANYLKRNLDQLQSEIKGFEEGLIEIIVSDNCSSDRTQEVVEEAHQAGLKINYIRNISNVGWALNFIQCFEQAKGKYVLLLGDDDVLIDGALSLIINNISEKNYGVVCIKPYGFDKDFRKEYPNALGKKKVYTDGNQFILAIDKHFTLTSVLILNKSLLKDIDSRQFIKTDLATFHLVLKAALMAKENLYINKFLLACQRRNSSSYEYSNVFVKQIWNIIDEHMKYNLSSKTIRSLENRKLFTYYPFYIMNLRIDKSCDIEIVYKNFKERFKSNLIFRFWVMPIILLPRPLAIIWGAITTLIGRVFNGDLYRGIKFGWNKIFN